jgi:hypothetical protein
MVCARSLVGAAAISSRQPAGTQQRRGIACIRPPAATRGIVYTLARISHQAAQDTDKTRVFWSKVLIVENTVCYSSLPVTVQAGHRVRKLALHSNRSYGYAFRYRAALVNTNPAHAPVILVRNADWPVSKALLQGRLGWSSQTTRISKVNAAFCRYFSRLPAR